ncbi:MAG: hypothetical protein WBF04_07005 [Candidatus Sulfotelmatobacter sp.]
MNFFRKLQTELAPAPAPAPAPQVDPLAVALAEEASAAEQERAASALCAQLDLEQKTWAQRRDRAYIQFCESLKRHASARAALARLAALGAPKEN